VDTSLVNTSFSLPSPSSVVINRDNLVFDDDDDDKSMDASCRAVLNADTSITARLYSNPAIADFLTNLDFFDVVLLSTIDVNDPLFSFEIL
jgi:hypothetical protein